MKVLDTNVLVALHHADHSGHTAAATWWEQSRSLGEPFTVPDLVWVGFTRVVTNPRAFDVPASVEDACTFADTVMQQPTYLTFSGHAGTLTEFRRISREAGARGNLLTDAYVAAVASAYGGTVVTFDRDFRKFDGVRVHELERGESST